MPTATIWFSFDPLLDVAGRPVHLETVVLAIVIFGVLVVAAAIARSVSIRRADPGLFVGGPRLRPDDLLFIVLGAIPGALVGGRIGYALVHLDFYLADPMAIFDPSVGGLQLTGAIVGGILTGAAIARLLDGSVGRWLHVAVLPLLTGLALGKVSMALGGSGQGLPSSASWGTAYLGPGPWGSLAPALPSEPSQLYEAGTSLVVVAMTAGLIAAGLFRRGDATAFLVGLALWTVGRTIVAFSWRDADVLGPLKADQLISIGLLASIVVILAVRRAVRSRTPDAGPVEDDGALDDDDALEPSWPPST